MYYIVYGFFFLLSLLPMRILYVLSDAIYLLVYHVLGYRRKVVDANLQLAFPHKTDEERKKIAKQFYHNLLDSFVEMIKLCSASKGFLQKRTTANWEVLEPLLKSGKSCQLHLGHTFNWEWGHHALTASTAYPILVVYMPIANAAFEKLMYKLRTRHGSTFIAPKNLSQTIESCKGRQYLLGLVADQSPGKTHTAYWTHFFDVPTAFVSGPERGARAGNLPVVFASIVKPKRGYYHATFQIATENAGVLPAGQLTLQYAAFMETTIRKNPDMWLWSHRRWKQKWSSEHAHNWIGELPVPSTIAINDYS